MVLMKAIPLLLILSGITTLTLAAEEAAVKPEIESVGLFKNGIAVVRATFPIGGPGIYRWDHVPQVIHGTFWVESDGEVAVLSTTRKIEETDETGAPSGIVAAGSRREGSHGHPPPKRLDPFRPYPPASPGRSGRCRRAPALRQWDTNYASLNPSAGSYYWWNGPPELVAPPPAAPPGNFLILNDPSGTRRYIDMSGIATVEAKGPFGAVKRVVDKPVLVFDVRKAPVHGRGGARVLADQRHGLDAVLHGGSQR
jgi:hypothetical protein